ncbi:flagellar hook-associated protein FlgK [Tumebacillus permanentifrigoris]|uniref:Flagellar hook-associated protein 1 n=1 Tax=Tumebacillus permanentifrigoris TaxID=378543 RepID=A0A316DF27_9BACL|nr:flagellar hook-associated protein FlgK [Tumebacillus permanentifrigoris]PWK16188.1 flagellar hook-associated protein 1 FlgK [Tumebacillus permanentifrigoris]
MTSTFFNLETGKRGLFAQQSGLSTVSQNVSNANTPGYSRQRVDLVTTASMYVPSMGRTMEAGQMGTGVVAGQITRIRESFLDAQFRNENTTSGEWTIRQDTLDKLQAVFNEPTDTGLSKVLDNFFLSWQTLGRNKDMASRNTVRQATIDLVETFNTVGAKLNELDTDIGDNISSKVNEFNTLTGQISDLNKQITTLEVLGDKANDLRDHRDYLVDQLSKTAGVTGKELPNGTYQLSVGTTVILSGDTPPVQLTYDAATNTTSFPVPSGEIGGMTFSRSNIISGFKSQLDSMINGMVNGQIQSKLPGDYTYDSTVTQLPNDITLANGTVVPKGTNVDPLYRTLPKGTTITFNGLNELHQFGFTATKPTSKAGVLFETTDSSKVFTASNIKVAKAILDDVQNIGSSNATYVDANGKTQAKEGNGDLAFMLGESVSATIDFKQGLPPNGAILAKGSVNDYMRATIGQLGLQAQTAERQVKNQGALIQQIDNRRQSISGVSLDEEMSNMIRFQQAYAASARVVTTAETILDTIIHLGGK